MGYYNMVLFHFVWVRRFIINYGDTNFVTVKEGIGIGE